MGSTLLGQNHCDSAFCHLGEASEWLRITSPTSDGLQPNMNGLQPNSEGLQPSSNETLKVGNLKHGPKHQRSDYFRHICAGPPSGGCHCE